MNDTMKNIGFAVAGVIVGFIIFGAISSEVPFAGRYSITIQDFSQGISVDGTTVIDGSRNATFSGTLGVTGISTLTEQLNVTEATGTSTTYISATAASVGGRIILEDHDGAGCSEIAILNGTIAAKTVTCP